jgi:hypothetical protein
MMTTLIVLATLIAAPLLFGVLLAVGLVGLMALYFGRGLINPPASLKQSRPVPPHKRLERLVMVVAGN